MKKDKQKLELRREKTHTYFRRIDNRHIERERTFKHDFANPTTNRFQLDRILGKLFTLPSIATNERANKGWNIFIERVIVALYNLLID